MRQGVRHLRYLTPESDPTVLDLHVVMCVRAFRGHFSPEHHHGIEVGGIYWHFVDVMWIVVYVTVYVL